MVIIMINDDNNNNNNNNNNFYRLGAQIPMAVLSGSLIKVTEVIN